MIATDSHESVHSTLDTSSGAIAQIAAVSKDAGLDNRFIDCMRTYALLGRRGVGPWNKRYLPAGHRQVFATRSRTHSCRPGGVAWGPTPSGFEDPTPRGRQMRCVDRRGGGADPDSVADVRYWMSWRVTPMASGCG